MSAPPVNALATINDYLTQRSGSLSKVLRQGDTKLDASMLVRLALMVIQQDKGKQLVMCSPQSILNSLMVAATLGLDPTLGTGKFYLIPRRNKGVLECCPLVGYKGLLELAMRHPRVSAINVQLVFTGEEFAIDPTHPTRPIRHAMRFDVAKSEQTLVGGYAICWLKNSRQPIWEFLPKVGERSIEARRIRSGATAFGPWKTDYLAMARKSVLRALVGGGTVPTREEMSTAIAVEQVLDSSEERGSHEMLSVVASGVDLELPPEPMPQQEETPMVVEHTEIPQDRKNEPVNQAVVSTNLWLRACQEHALNPEDAQDLVRKVGGPEFANFDRLTAGKGDLISAAEFLLRRLER